jgi:maltodextrin utilization protein YvdJ
MVLLCFAWSHHHEEFVLQVALVLILLLQTLSSFMIVIGILKMTFRRRLGPIESDKRNWFVSIDC